jgi:hypothetical protein
MKVLPFILAKKKVNTFTITSVNVFLAHGGKSVWKTEESGLLPLQTVLGDYCEPNDIYGLKSYVDTENQTAYIQVDPEKTNLSEFYTWEEALHHSTKPECWRRFYFIQDTDGADWWSPDGLTETEIQDYGNTSQLLQIIQTYFRDT